MFFSQVLGIQAFIVSGIQTRQNQGPELAYLYNTNMCFITILIVAYSNIVGTQMQLENDF